ncbi:hypothetical protein GGF46_005162 [Coemansia sp. RSA 552]|nr:hypothetical protein GGF46_005162 [Coemansia sp. RSA 552]
MFGFAASWGRKLQADLQIDQFVDQVKRQSEEVSRAYSQDLSEFAQAVKAGATKGMGELSTRFAQLKTDLSAELNSDASHQGQIRTEGQEQADDQTRRGVGESSHAEPSLVNVLRQQQAKTKRLLSRLGTDLEDLLRDAIVIEAPGSAGTEEQRKEARRVIYDRRMAQLAALQENEDTYVVDPRTATASNEAEDKAGNKDVLGKDASSEFERFMAETDLGAKGDEKKQQLLQDNSAMRDIHSRLVPDKVAEDEFWTRYFFRAWQVDQEELRRKKLVEAAVIAAEADEEFSWDTDDENDAAKPPENSHAVQEKTVATDKPAEDAAANDAKPAGQEQPKAADKGTSKKPDNDDDDGWGEWE